jgi:hypothetical protein
MVWKLQKKEINFVRNGSINHAATVNVMEILYFGDYHE